MRDYPRRRRAATWESRWLAAVERITRTTTESDHARAVADADELGRIVALGRTPLNDGEVSP